MQAEKAARSNGAHAQALERPVKKLQRRAPRFGRPLERPRVNVIVPPMG